MTPVLQKASRTYLRSLVEEHARLFPDGQRQLAPHRLRWAQAIVCTRGFEVDDRTLMAPCLDFMNHSADGCKLRSTSDGAVVAVTTRAYEAGEEVCLNYGPSKTDAELLAYHGILTDTARVHLSQFAS